AIIVELRVAEPLIPLTLFKNRTFTMSVLASIAVGIALFATIVYLGQYMQIARGRTVIESSLLSLPMMAGMLGSSTVIGQLVSRRGKWKGFMIAGGFLLLAGMLLLGQMRYDTSYWYVGVGMFVLGCGIGMTMQNLVLVVQNTVEPTQMGAASSGVTFFRTLAGSAGMSVMGTLLGHKVSGYMADGVTDLQTNNPQALTDPDVVSALQGLQSGTLPKVSTLPDVLRTIVESSYGHAIGDVFLYVSPVAVLAIIAIGFIPNLPLSTQSNAERMRSHTLAEDLEERGVEFAAATTGSIVLPHAKPVPSPQTRREAREARDDA
ncbi:MAG: MFS transporter, partial [Microbacterium sp.]